MKVILKYHWGPGKPKLCSVVLATVHSLPQKFQAIREDARRRLIEKMGSQLMQKAEADIKQKLEGFE